MLSLKFSSMNTILILLFTASISFAQPTNKEINLIPKPAKMRLLEGNFHLSANLAVSTSNVVLQNYFISQTEILTGIKLIPASSTSEDITLNIDKSISSNTEAYMLAIGQTGIKITGASEEGLFRGIQTLFQLIPSETKTKKKDSATIPCLTISDEPRFSYRGLNLDCSRHFMSKDFIKRYIDILAYYKFNTFHWHLTDDQGWRIEIKKYPKLTEVGAWRKEADGSIYGGYYTQNDIKEIVAYAQSRYITIIPEIEMPGHSTASLASYPENSCAGGPFEVTNLFGVFKDIYCAGNENVYTFLQNILDEVCELFPGKYIHIGGDEAPKERWEQCSKCQAKIKAEGLKDEHELQSYFIKRMSSYLTSKGKTAIGWDEILQGGLAPGVAVQSWQSFQGAVDAARLGHYVVCSPASHTYLNGDPENLDLRIAYSFNPVPSELTKEEAKYILGGEANLWTERAPLETVDSKLFPRILAIAEVLWSDPAGRDYDEFYSRVTKNYDDMSALGIRYGQGFKMLNTSVSYNEEEKSFYVNIDKAMSGIDVRYTIENKDVTASSPLYNKPIKINSTASLKIQVFQKGEPLGATKKMSFVFHKGLNSSLALNSQYTERYRAGGPNALIDGVRGSSSDFRDGCWQGYEGTDLECVIDLGEVKEISKISPRFMLDANSWIFLPSIVEASVSEDGKTFTNKVVVENTDDQKSSEIYAKDFTLNLGSSKIRYIKLKAVGLEQCPAWHPYAGNKCWLFIDEIVVE